MSFYTTYRDEIRPRMVSGFDGNIMAVPNLEKVVIDMGIGQGSKNKELIDGLAKDLSLIAGQKAQTRLARQAVSGFGTRKGDPVGLRATLRGRRMYDFLEKLIKIVLPRLRDFRGVSRFSFDGRGNYSLGITDHTIFPEVERGSSRPWGLGITIVTSAKEDRGAKNLLEEFGMPFEKGDG